MTIILNPKCGIDKLDGLTIKIAQIMKKTIDELYGYELKIKEPNDLMIKKYVEY